MSDSDADQSARIEALDPARSFVVQAPAGSGKTGLLTQRFLRLLALVDAPEQVVAITFTRKAAAQMRHQVVQALSRAGEPHASQDAHAQLTRELAAAALARAKALQWELESHPARLCIQTIDAFCHSLAAQLPMLSRAGAELQVTDDARPLYAEAARRTLAQLDEQDSIAAAVAVQLRHRDNELYRTEQLLLELLRRRDQWLPLLVGMDRQRPRERLEADLAFEITRSLERLARRWPVENLQAVAALAAFAAANLGPEAGALASWHDVRTAPRPVVEDLPRWRELVHWLLTGKGTWRRKFTRLKGIPATARDQKAALTALIDELSRMPALGQLLREVRCLPPAQLTDDQWRVAEALLRLLQVAAAELELLFRERGEVDHVAVAQAAVTALGNAEEPGELALALDYRLRHLLVDEFQDSSYTQVRLLAALTAGWSDGDGRTLFCVGDPMQSIYRFRQAEVGLFLRTRDRGLGALRPTALTLERNFRSAAELVQWFNQVFVHVLPSQDDIERGAVRHAASIAARNPLGRPAVQVHCSFLSDHRLEAQQIVKVIAEYRERAPSMTIGVLVRQRQHAVPLTKTLRERGIRFQAVELEPLIGQPVVRDLLALSRALLHAGDRTAWLALLRSPMCGLTLADLEALTRAAPDRACLELLRDAPRVATLSTDGQARARRLWSTLDAAIALNGRLSLRAWVEGTWLGLGGPAAAGESRAIDDAAAFFGRLEQIERTGILPAGSAFDAEFADLYAPPDPAAPPQLQIMTIHKAKGLEFDVVVLPGLGRGRGGHETPLLRWLEVPRTDGDSGLLLAPIGRRGSEGDALFDYLGFREEQREAFERARLMYVSASRAREALHLFGHVRLKRAGDDESRGRPESQSLLALLWPSVSDEFERAFAARQAQPVVAATIRERQPASIARYAADWHMPEPPPALGSRAPAAPEVELQPGRPTFDWAGEVSRHVGTVVHAELERWSRLAELPDAREVDGRRALYARQLETRAVPAELVPAAVDRIAGALLNTLSDPRGRWIFDRAHRDPRSEYALSGVVDDRIVSVIIDRTFVDTDGLRWVVDFKTSTHEGGAVETFLDQEVERYRPQLQHYARMVRGIGGEAVRVGLYFPLLGGWREWAP